MAPRLEAEDPLFGNHPTSKVLSSITSQVSWGKKKRLKDAFSKAECQQKSHRFLCPMNQLRLMATSLQSYQYRLITVNCALKGTYLIPVP
jgi:hypothetical protein